MNFSEICEAGRRHLRKRDRVMRGVIDEVGPCRLTLRRGRFGMLANSILSQQISGHAARAIRGRLLDRLGGKLTPEGLAALSDAEYRAVGVSAQKAGYLRSLGQHALDGKVRLTRIGKWSDQEIIDELVQIKGVGVWTAQMFLMFSVGRPDVLPWDDLGVRSAMRNLYGLDELPKRDEAERIAEPWRPYATVASWYCWRSLDIVTPEV